MDDLLFTVLRAILVPPAGVCDSRRVGLGLHSTFQSAYAISAAIPCLEYLCPRALFF